MGAVLEAAVHSGRKKSFLKRDHSHKNHVHGVFQSYLVLVVFLLVLSSIYLDSFNLDFDNAQAENVPLHVQNGIEVSQKCVC